MDNALKRILIKAGWSVRRGLGRAEAEKITFETVWTKPYAFTIWDAGNFIHYPDGWGHRLAEILNKNGYKTVKINEPFALQFFPKA